MKGIKFKNKIVLAVLAGLSVTILLAGCQTVTKSFGGNMTLELEPGQKLEEITWKEDSLWYLTRPMREDEVPETHTFQQSSNFGIIEGTVTVIESAELGDEQNAEK